MVLCMILSTAPPKRWTDHVMYVSCETHPCIPVVTPFKDPSSFTPRAGKGTCFLLLLPDAAAPAPIKPCLKFSSDFLPISID